MTERTFHDVTQGSPEWHALRARHFTASEAAAMMGVSPYETRGALLRRKAAGIAADVDAATQRRFDDGHEAEAAYRPIAEQEIGDDLYPVTITADIDGLPLLASMDGLTMDGTIGFEHKLYNAETARIIDETGEPPIHHVWQLEHQMLVSGAEKILFVTSDGTQDRAASCWYVSKPERRKALIEGWRQFQRDLRDPETLAEFARMDSPAPTGRAPESLPALRIEVTGAVTASNLAEFKSHALAVFKGINRDLRTDQDFADAERTIKWCADVEARLKAAKDAALAQTADIAALFRAIDDIAAEARNTRLELDKLVKARKDAIRKEIAQEALARLREQIARDSLPLGEFAPAVPADALLRIAEAMKGKKTVQSLRDAADGARAALAAELSARIARRAANLATVRQIESETGFGDLWRYDLATLLDSEPAQLVDVLRGRIAAHRDAEEARARRAQSAASMPAQPDPFTQPLPAVDHIATPADARAEINASEIARRLGFALTQAFIEGVLGVPHVRKERTSVYWREADWPRICHALAQHVIALAQLPQVSARDAA